VIQTEGSAGYRLLLPMDCQHVPSESASPDMLRAIA
jgi:hypothetical protein